MRSLLFIPGDSERKLEKGFAAGADAVIVDLEDSVAEERKAAARRVAAETVPPLRRLGGGPLVFARVNDLASGMTDADLAAVMPLAPDGIMLPKSNGAADVEHLSAKLRVLEAEHGLDDGATRIVALMSETPIGLLSASSYGRHIPRLAGLTWGAEDLSAALGARATRDEDGRYTEVFRYARTMALLAAAAAGVAAIDAVYPDFRDIPGLRAECAAAERDGFTAKMAIHPEQVTVINEVFTPDEAAVAHARAVVAAFAAVGDPGVVAIEGRMYDRPHLRLARRLLERAGAGG